MNILIVSGRGEKGAPECFHDKTVRIYLGFDVFNPQGSWRESIMEHAKSATRVYIDIGHGKHEGVEDFTSRVREVCRNTHIVADHADAEYAEAVRLGSGVRHVLWLEIMGKILDKMR